MFCLLESFQYVFSDVETRAVNHPFNFIPADLLFFNFVLKKVQRCFLAHCPALLNA